MYQHMPTIYVPVPPHTFYVLIRSLPRDGEINIYKKKTLKQNVATLDL